MYNTFWVSDKWCDFIIPYMLDTIVLSDPVVYAIRKATSHDSVYLSLYGDLLAWVVPP